MSGRRGFLSMTAGAVAITPVPAAPSTPAPHLDALLLRLDAELSRVWAVENEAWARMEDADEYDDDGPCTVAANACMAVTGEVVRQIERAHAHTLVGLRVKLRAVTWCRGGAPIEARDFTWGSPPSADARILASIINDLARMREV